MLRSFGRIGGHASCSLARISMVSIDLQRSIRCPKLMRNITLCLVYVTDLKLTKLPVLQILTNTSTAARLLVPLVFMLPWVPLILLLELLL